MERYFKKDYVVHIEGKADSFVIANLAAKLLESVSEIILKEHIECDSHCVTEACKQDGTTYEIFE